MSKQKTISTAQLYRNLMHRVKNLVLQPHSEWTTVRGERKNLNEVLGEFSLPLISLVTLATFLNILVNHQGFNFELALKHAALIFTSLFGGLYLAWLALKSVSGLSRVQKGLLTLLIGFSIHLLPLLVRQILFNLIHF